MYIFVQLTHTHIQIYMYICNICTRINQKFMFNKQVKNTAL